MTKRIVVLGGGFAGVSAAQELARQLRRKHRLAGASASRSSETIEVLLLNRDNYFVFQPLLADIISGTIETTHVVVPLRRMLPGCGVEVGYVEGIEVGSRTIRLRRRLSGQVVLVRYNALIIALGGVTDLAAVPGMAEHGVGVRTLGDAFYLRNRALDMLEEARIESDPERRERLLTFVVVGGGSTGVEVAAELKDLVELAARSFQDVRLGPRVVLVHSRPIVLSELGERLGRYATKKLREAGIDLRLGRRVARVEVDRVELDDGTTIPTATVVSTVGNAPNPALASVPAARDGRGWLTPDATFALPGVENVWALGDCASIIDPRTDRPMPATAQHAVREGPHAARNVLAALDGRAQTPFDYGQLGMLVSVGRFKAVGEVLGIKVSGLLGWFLWRSYYLLRLPTLDRRIRVAIDWTLDLILKHDIVQIGVRRTKARPGESPGELAGEPVSMGARPETPDELTL
jgi:NADH dehydrogenase